MRVMSKISILLTVLALLVQQSISMKISRMTSLIQPHKEQQRNEQKSIWDVLEQTWHVTEYLLDDFPKMPKNYSISKQEWKERYSSFFHTPEWLTEQKFLFCDWNGDSIIQANEAIMIICNVQQAEIEEGKPEQKIGIRV